MQCLHLSTVRKRRCSRPLYETRSRSLRVVLSYLMTRFCVAIDDRESLCTTRSRGLNVLPRLTARSYVMIADDRERLRTTKRWWRCLITCSRSIERIKSLKKRCSFTTRKRDSLSEKATCASLAFSIYIGATAAAITIRRKRLRNI